MSYFLNNEQKVNEIIFAQRNKNYGAYAIRSSYGNTVFKSLFLVVSTCALFCAMVYILSNGVEAINLVEQVIPSEKIYTITPVKIPHEEPSAIKPEHSAEKPSPKNQHDITPVVVDSVAIETHSSTVERTEISSTSSGSTSTQGTETSSVASGSGTATVITKIEETYSVDSEPVFEGGLAALYNFISKNVRYPAIAREEGKQGTIHVKFVVDESGKVTNLSLRNSAGFGMDEEALRVVGMIPKFKTPAMVKGHAVKVYYQLPIKFKLGN